MNNTFYTPNDWWAITHSELYHHGIKGQHWGVKNGPPYPIEQHRTRNAKKASDVMNTLSKKEKYYLTMDKNNPKEYTTQSDYKKAALYSDILQVKGQPVAVFDIWKSWNDNHGQISLATAKGYQGQGYAMKLGRRAMDWFNKSNLRYLVYSVHKDNISSQKLAERLGFRQLTSKKELIEYEFDEPDYGDWQIWVKDKRDIH